LIYAQAAKQSKEMVKSLSYYIDFGFLTGKIVQLLFRGIEIMVLSQNWEKTELSKNIVLGMLQRNVFEELYD